MGEKITGNKTNFHSHSLFCDGKAPLEAFVKSAVEAGFTAYGVSSHAPLPFKTAWNMDREEVPAYLREMERLKEVYRDRIALYTGMEIDYLNEVWNPASDYFQQLPLDFRIGSVHLVYTPEGEIVDTDTGAESFKQLIADHFAGSLEAIVGACFEASLQLVEKGGFDFIGHPNKIAFNAEAYRPGATGEPWYKVHVGRLFEALKENHIMVEINTKAYLTKGCFFPDRSLFGWLKELELPVVVNSDAHRPELVDAGRREALKALKESGIRSVMELEAGSWVPKEIV
ncbi:MAG: histidinol-phosphatase [Culturomica sp.]|jgi:histidinol-phosphatase (PHP family)|nr:histidinol-phosphatase [Culturomica sp.]